MMMCYWIVWSVGSVEKILMLSSDFLRGEAESSKMAAPRNFL